MFGKLRRGNLMVVMLGALVAAILTTTAAAPVARADDPFTEIIDAVQGDFTFAQQAFELSNAAFARGDLADGLVQFYNGADEYLLSVPNNILQGSLAALLGESIDSSYTWDIPVPADFNDALIVAPTLTVIAVGELQSALSDLTSGDLTGALDSYLTGFEYLNVIVPELFIVGTVAGFGF